MKKVLTFAVSSELYCYDILNVVGIDQVGKITPVPLSPNFLLGLMNLRGQIIPVTDLRLLFGKQVSEKSKESCIIFVDTPRGRMGCLVDGVRDVIELSQDSEGDPQQTKAWLQHQNEESYIRSVFKYKEDIVFLLDLESVFDSVNPDALVEEKKAA